VAEIKRENRQDKKGVGQMKRDELVDMGKMLTPNNPDWIESILKEHIQVCNCDGDDNWHIDEADFEQAITALKAELRRQINSLPCRNEELDIDNIVQWIRKDDIKKALGV